MAVRFDAVTDVIERAVGPTIASTGYTFCAWVYLSVDRNDYSTIMRVSASGSTRGNLASSENGQTLSYYTIGGSLTGSTTMTEGAWHRVAISVTSAGIGTLYSATETGSVVNVAGNVTASDDSNNVSIGGRGAGDTSEWFNGRVAYARMWTAALSQSEIEAEWASTSPVRTSGLWADWPLPSASDLTDHSGNGRHLTPTSTGPTTEDGPSLGGALTDSVTDSAGSSDSVIAAVSYARPLTDSAGASDTTAVAMDLARSIADATGSSDSVSVAVSLSRTVTDASGMSDAASVSLGYGDSVSDDSGTSDAATIFLDYARTITDSSGCTDEVTVLLTSSSREIIDSAGVSDAVSVAISRFITITDETGFSDHVSVIGSDDRNITMVATIPGRRITSRVGTMTLPVISMPAESKELIGPIQVLIDGNPVDVFQVTLTAGAARPTTWASPDVVGADSGILVGLGTSHTLTVGTKYTVWAKYTSVSEAPVTRVAYIKVT